MAGEAANYAMTVVTGCDTVTGSCGCGALQRDFVAGLRGRGVGSQEQRGFEHTEGQGFEKAVCAHVRL